MRNRSNTSIHVPSGEATPRILPEGIKRIVKWNGIFHRAVETEDFIYFANYQEGDDNANCIMYRKADRSLASDNYFASNDLFGLMVERPEEITYLSPTAKYNLKCIQEDAGL